MQDSTRIISDMATYCPRPRAKLYKHHFICVQQYKCKPRMRCPRGRRIYMVNPDKVTVVFCKRDITLSRFRKMFFLQLTVT